MSARRCSNSPPATCCRSCSPSPNRSPVGWIGVSLYPAPVPVWGLFDAALPVAPDRAVSEFLLGGVHGPLGLLIGFLDVAHIAAALKHGLVDRDGVLGRMF